MTDGSNTPPNYLWKVRFKINAPDGGLNFMVQMAEVVEATAITNATDIAARLRAILPSVCDIYSATISKSNSQKDSRMLPDAIGPGEFGQGGVDPVASTYNQFTDAVLMRFEDADGGFVPMKIGPVPDTFIVAGGPSNPVLSLSDPSIAVPATAVQPVTYQTELKNLCHAIAKYCHHVQSKNNIPGGAYKFTTFTKVHFKRISKKRGGRVFTK